MDYLSRKVVYKSDFIAGDNKIIKDRTTTLSNFSGVDLLLHNKSHSIKIQSIAYSISREMAPVRCFFDGSIDFEPRGKNKIAGNIVFISPPEHQKYDYLKLYLANEEGTKAATQYIYNIELLDDNNHSNMRLFIAESMSDWQFSDIQPNICECGAESCGFTAHSSYCPKFK